MGYTTKEFGETKAGKSSHGVTVFGILHANIGHDMVLTEIRIWEALVCAGWVWRWV